MSAGLPEPRAGSGTASAPRGSTSLAALGSIGVEVLSSVGRARREALEAVGISTVLDLVTHYPRRYLDRTNQVDVVRLAEGSEAMVLGKIRKVSSPRRSRQGRWIVDADLFDGTGYLRLTFFNQRWRAQQLREGVDTVVFGKVERFKGRAQMTNPLVDLVGTKTGRIVAVYPQSERVGLTSEQIAEAVGEALERFAGDLTDPLPASVRTRYGLAGRTWAVRQAHLPESMEAKDMARRRLGFDELLRLQMILVLRKRSIERDSIGICHPGSGALLSRFRDELPFTLTSAQERAMAEIAADLSSPHPMHRLLQGDVGSGKTVVAAAALLTAVQGGRQGAFMAPTEVLAEQHYAGLRELVEGLSVPSEGALMPERPVGVALLTNRTSAPARARLHARLADGTLDILVGTHALLSGDVAWRDLGVVVIDEQHRFGVEQRAALRAKGAGETIPDVLVMTATPIPRTAAMTVFGDLDTTVLDSLPAGRAPIRTIWVKEEAGEREAWERVRSEVSCGHQAYVVCPLVEGSERVQARSASEEHDRLAEGALAGLRLGLLHGQLPAAKKEAVMAEFRAGGIDVLVATTVVEVGVDVPGATVMVIEDADRFGIAQLHQLRGRVGRSSLPSWCYLLGTTASEEGSARLRALTSSNDGFELAEIDLELRGEGTILGSRQKGISDLKLASLRRHKKTVALTREVAFGIVDSDPLLVGHPDLAEEIAALVDPDEREFLFKS